MHIILLFFTQFLLSSTYTLLNKRFQLRFQYDPAHFMCYNLINAVFSSINYFISIGFRIQMNGITFLFSVIYGLIVICSMCLNMVSLRHLTIPMNSVMGSSGSIMTSSLFGFLYLKEELTVYKILALLAILIAVILPWAQTFRRREKTNFKQILLCVIVFLVSGLGNITFKLYAVTPNACEDKQFFLMTNLVIVVLCGIGTVIYFLKQHIHFSTITHLFKLNQIINLGGITIVSNIQAVVNITLLGLLAISSYNIISSSISMGVSTLLSVVFFREKLTVIQFCSVVLVVLATALCTL